MKCVACSKELTKKEALYTKDRQAYCVNPFACTDAHPNSTANILKRQGAVTLYTEDQLESTIFESLNVPEHIKERIVKVATKPQSVRLSKIDIAYYLVALQETKGFSSLAEAIRYCVDIAMEQEPILGIERKEKPATLPEKPSGIVAVVPEVEPQPKKEEPEESETIVF